MTTTSERGAAAAAVAPEPSPEARRFVDELAQMQSRLTYRGLPDAILGEPLCRLEGYGDGLTTICARQSQFPERYLRGVLGFRLAQFLQTGLMDIELAYRRGWWHEPPVPPTGVETIHTVTLTEMGKIVGYLGFVGSPDPDPLPLDARERGKFPVELAHHVELLSEYASPERHSHGAYEIKRFIRDRSMERGPQRDRVPWHLILAVGRMALAIRIQMILGDSGERGALRHLRLVGLPLAVVENTVPSLPRTQLMWPSYLVGRDKLAKPFVGPVEGVEPYIDAIEMGLIEDKDTNWQEKAINRLVELHKQAGTLQEVMS
jgi:hypothetical protein